MHHRFMSGSHKSHPVLCGIMAADTAASLLSHRGEPFRQIKGDMKEILSKLIRGIMGRDIRTHASSIAFFFFMALIPLLILLASVVPFFGISADNVMQFFQEVLPPGAVPITRSIVREAFDHSAAAFSVSILLLLWTASRGVAALIEGLNSMYEEKETRGFLKLTVRSFGYTLVLMVFLCAAIYLIFSGRISELLKSALPQIHWKAGVSTLIEYLALFLAGFALFGYVYTSLPSGRRSFARQFPGAFLASAGWVFFSMGIRVYVSLFNSFTHLYGSLAAVILLLFWFYWIFFILLLGGYVNAHMTQLIPEEYLAFYHSDKRFSLMVFSLFLLGVLSYLSECYMNCRLYVFPSLRYLIIVFRFLTMAAWLTATLLCLKGMKRPIPRKRILILCLMMAGSCILLRRSLFSNLFVYLIILTLWNIVILFACGQILLGTEGKTEEKLHD